MRAYHAVLAAVGLASLAAVAVWWPRGDGAPPRDATTASDRDDPAPGSRARTTPRDRPEDALPSASSSSSSSSSGDATGSDPRRARARELQDHTSIAAANALVERLAAAVPLATDTRDALTEVLLAEREAAATIMEASPPGSDERQRQLDQLRADTHARVVALLDDAQLAAYRQIRPL